MSYKSGSSPFSVGEKVLLVMPPRRRHTFAVLNKSYNGPPFGSVVVIKKLCAYLASEACSFVHAYTAEGYDGVFIAPEDCFCKLLPKEEYFWKLLQAWPHGKYLPAEKSFTDSFKSGKLNEYFYSGIEK